jgi:hypothetical protein
VQVQERMNKTLEQGRRVSAFECKSKLEIFSCDAIVCGGGERYERMVDE